MINKVFVQINDCTNNFYIHSILNSISNAACMSHFFIFLYFSISILIFHYFLNLYNKYFFFYYYKISYKSHSIFICYMAKNTFEESLDKIFNL